MADRLHEHEHAPGHERSDRCEGELLRGVARAQRARGERRQDERQRRQCDERGERSARAFEPERLLVASSAPTGTAIPRPTTAIDRAGTTQVQENMAGLGFRNGGASRRKPAPNGVMRKDRAPDHSLSGPTSFHWPTGFWQNL